MKRDGVTFHLNDGVETIKVLHEETPCAELELRSGVRFKADTVLYSIGRTAATDTLDLKTIGLPTDAAAASRSTRTTRPRSNTSGPRAMSSDFLHSQPSSEQGRIAACRMFGVKSPDMGRNYPYGIYSIPKYQWSAPLKTS